MTSKVSFSSALLLALAAAGCAANRPVLYPNAHYRSVGKAAAERDVQECIAEAQGHGATSDRNKEIARDTATGAAVGAAAGAAGGAVSGHAGRGAAAGAAGGAAAGVTHGIIQSFEVDPIHRNFVERCLGDKGYDVIGWK
jgi:hypothetical protein